MTKSCSYLLTFRQQFNLWGKAYSNRYIYIDEYGAIEIIMSSKVMGWTVMEQQTGRLKNFFYFCTQLTNESACIVQHSIYQPSLGPWSKTNIPLNETMSHWGLNPPCPPRMRHLKYWTFWVKFCSMCSS